MELAYAASGDPRCCAYLRPEAVELLTAMPPQTTWDVNAVRAEDERFLSEAPSLPEAVAAAWTKTPEAGSGSVPMREVGVSDPNRVVVSIHGGGFISGSAAYEDLVNAELAQTLNARVFAPEYRLAPEHPYPAALEDCLAAICHAASFGMPVTVYGDSAGAGLALAAACRLNGWSENAGAHGENEDEARAAEALDSLVLLEPCADPRQNTVSFAIHADGPVWTAEASRHAWRQYLGAVPADDLLPEVMIDAATARGTFPATFVAANFVDPLRDEAIAIATRLADRGVRTELRIPAGTYHATLAVHGTPVWNELRRAIAAFVG